MSATTAAAPPLLQVDNLKTYFPIRAGVMRRVVNWVRAVDGVSFRLRDHQTLALVGESGCGKSTVGRSIMQLIPPTEGDVYLQGQSLTALSRRKLIKTRLQMQLVFQNPTSSLNPRMTVEELITDALLNHRLLDRPAAVRRAAELMQACGLNAAQLRRYPHEFSGGQRQRINIARALAMSPKLIICDESVSALDVSVQAQILNLLRDLQQQFGVAYLFISHDMGVVRFVADRVAVMYLGRIVELADRDTLFDAARHPYTRALLSAVPAQHPAKKRQRIVLAGDVPAPTREYPGCPFVERCPEARPGCRNQVPQPDEIAPGHRVACLRVQNGEI